MARLLAAPFMAGYLTALEDRAVKVGTTHLNVIDAAGNAAALSVSNGEGCGHILPGSDIMLNTMLGEEDINPLGFFRWRPEGRLLALGSGDSNRIRSAILQVLLGVLQAGRGPRPGRRVATPTPAPERGYPRSARPGSAPWLRG